ncbi:SusC/RagA family TonB-linked outer membrane protein [Spirosoma endbachense]|uniref:SusC/RagA family TonB-linked outer membrane protein n=1 Tax=Spirosoma endbachense TaxID=2666025 RepID=A0A6P1VM15_9BACT|nr:SusC/RagA family TonB-linked outer membrane protein [Spirosoma endbachense]QHV93634.1 SusC/RagA family TonB-linked outer membrane protein [Spirosoma endbachense]
MKRLLSLLISVLLSGSLVHAVSISAQELMNRPVSITVEGETVRTVLQQLEKAVDVRFVYSPRVIGADKRISISARNERLSSVLQRVFSSLNVSWEVINGQIILKKVDAQSNLLSVPVFQINTPVVFEQPKRLLSGLVRDFASNQPLPGVSIVVKGTTRGTTTSANGSFSLTIPDTGDNLTLSFSFIGYETLDVPVNSSQATINVSLKETHNALNEVVVVGYGTQKKVNLTGAVSQVLAKDLENRPLNNMSQILQGMVPNLNITFGTGQPGAGGTLNVRGETSINGGGPLVLIDGIPGDINRINPGDVESVSVLKDAAASAIYGARGAFGVVLVTTKTAKNGKTTISYSNNFGWSTPTVSTKFLTNGYEYVRMNDEAFTRATGNSYTRYSEEDYKELEARRYDKVENPARPWTVVKNVNGKDIYNYYGNYDWWNTLFNMTEPSRQHNINLSGGTDKINYFLSGSVFEKDGIMRINTDKFTSYTLRSKINAQLTPWLKVSNNTQYFDSKYKYPGLEGGANANFVGITVHALPAYAPLNPDGTATYNTLKNNYSIGDGLFANLLKGVAGGEKKIHELTTINSVTIDFTKHWNLVANYSFSFYINDEWYRAAVAQYSIQPGILTTVPNYNTDQYKKTLWFDPMNATNLYSSYNQTFGKHSFGATAGINYETRKHQRLFGARKNLLSESLNDLDLGTGEQLSAGDAFQYALFGAFYRLNYDFLGKYLLEVNGRYDGTSRFGEGKRYGFFPSVSAGWRVSEEGFFDPIRGVVDNLKIRASYGTLGNQLPPTPSNKLDPYNIVSANYYPYVPIMPTAQSGWITNGQKPSYVNSPNPISSDLTWEKATTSNIGVDAGLLKNRLNLSFDAYIRNTTGMLVPGQVLPSVYGASVPTKNAGDLQTKGFELSIGWRDQFKVAGKALSYNASFVLSDSKSIITKYDNPNKILSSRYEGQTIGEIWGYSIDGFFKTNDEAQAYKVDQTIVNKQRLSAPGDWSKLQAGDLKFIDRDGNGKIDQGANTLADHGDLKVIGNDRARYRYGINLGATWNGLDLSLLAQGILRKNWYPGNNADKFWGPYSRPYYSFIPENFEDDVWTPTNTNAYFPVLRGYTALNGGGDLNAANDRYIQNVGYLRLKNVVIGYTFPETLTKRIRVPRARIYVSGENLLTYTPLRSKYIDPEQLDGDTTNGRTYPLSKTFSAGLNITF